MASTIQMAVLLLFNSKNSHTVKELAKLVGTDATLMQQVVSTLIRNNLLVCTVSLYLESQDAGNDDLPEQDESGTLPLSQ